MTGQDNAVQTDRSTDRQTGSVVRGEDPPQPQRRGRSERVQIEEVERSSRERQERPAARGCGAVSGG